jgi:altronate dehydratase
MWEVQMGGKTQVIVINEKDNVATALKPLKAGTKVSVEVQGRIDKIKLLSDIPMGHKFSLKDMEEGEAVIKYGEPIGRSTEKIAQGEHVHVHNVASEPRGGLR